jgi:hypothetical protein
MKTIFGLAAMCIAALGQDAKPVQKLIQLKYVDAGSVHNLLRSYVTTGGWTMQSDDRMHMIAVTGSPEAVASIEEAIKKLDVAPTDFDLTVYLISSAPNDILPAALTSTAKQLHGVFAYSGYQLLESFVLRGRDGRGGSSGGAFHGSPSSYSFRYEQASVSSDTPKTIHLRGLDLNLRFRTGALTKEGQPAFTSTGLNTDIDIREGQKVVVGKSDLNNGDSPLILVVTAKVVE